MMRRSPGVNADNGGALLPATGLPEIVQQRVPRPVIPGVDLYETPFWIDDRRAEVVRDRRDIALFGERRHPEPRREMVDRLGRARQMAPDGRVGPLPPR